MKKNNSFKPLHWNVSENCDVDVSINLKRNIGNNYYSLSFLRDLRVFIVLFFIAYAANDNSKKKTQFAGIHVYSRGISGFTGSRVHEANISKTDPVILPL